MPMPMPMPSAGELLDHRAPVSQIMAAASVRTLCPQDNSRPIGHTRWPLQRQDLAELHRIG
jgi:hypothetical protein